MNIPERSALSDLRNALAALSQDAAGEYLAVGMRPDTLALQFGHAVLHALSNLGDELTPQQVHVLNSLAALLNQMSANREDIWTDEAVRHHPVWQQVRTLARDALSALGRVH